MSNENYDPFNEPYAFEVEQNGKKIKVQLVTVACCYDCPFLGQPPKPLSECDMSCKFFNDQSLFYYDFPHRSKRCWKKFGPWPLSQG